MLFLRAVCHHASPTLPLSSHACFALLVMSKEVGVMLEKKVLCTKRGFVASLLAKMAVGRIQSSRPKKKLRRRPENIKARKHAANKPAAGAGSASAACKPAVQFPDQGIHRAEAAATLAMSATGPRAALGPGVGTPSGPPCGPGDAAPPSSTSSMPSCSIHATSCACTVLLMSVSVPARQNHPIHH